jgi:hypothetical protein
MMGVDGTWMWHGWGVHARMGREMRRGWGWGWDVREPQVTAAGGHPVLALRACVCACARACVCVRACLSARACRVRLRVRVPARAHARACVRVAGAPPLALRDRGLPIENKAPAYQRTQSAH